MIRTADIISKSMNLDKAAHNVVEDFVMWNEVTMPSAPTHIAVSRDGLSLAVCTVQSHVPVAHIYDVRAFTTKVCNCKYKLTFN